MTDQQTETLTAQDRRSQGRRSGCRGCEGRRSRRQGRLPRRSTAAAKAATVAAKRPPSRRPASRAPPRPRPCRAKTRRAGPRPPGLPPAPRAPYRRPDRQDRSDPTSNEGTRIMKNEANQVADRIQAVFGDVNERAKTAIERNTKVAEEMTELTKGNVEALVASTKIAAKGVETDRPGSRRVQPQELRGRLGGPQGLRRGEVGRPTSSACRATSPAPSSTASSPRARSSARR